MQSTHGGLRRSLAVALAVTAAGGATAAALMGPAATAATDPCATSEVARTAGSVATNIGSYLDAHPQTNQALTNLSQQQAGPQTLGNLKAYFDANPQAAKDLQALQQPLASLGSRCKLPISLPQVVGLIQAAQQSGGTGASLPAASQAAQNLGVPGAAVPAQSSPASAVTATTGGAAGSASATTR